MATNKLTDTRCRTEKPGDKPKKLSDGNGMYLYVSPAGAKIWRMAYKDKHGKEQVNVIGPYPLVGLADARTKRDEFRRLLLDGVDVKAKPKRSITFKEAYTEYWNDRKDVTDKYRTNALNGLGMHLKVLDSVPVGDITRASLLEPLMALNAQGKYVYVRKVRIWASMAFEWAKSHGHTEINPAELINPKVTFGNRKVKHHAAIKLVEMPAFLQRLGLERELQSVLACWMIAYTWVRTTELRKMLWTEIEGNVWRLPEGRMKMGREHLVPLPRQALALLENLKLRSRGSIYVFPNDRRLDRPMSENAVLYLLGRIGYGGMMTGHGWRTVTSTWANEKGYNRDAVEMQLAHSDNNKVRSAYNQAEYLAERTQMLQDWADYLDNVNTSTLQGGELPQDCLAA